MPKFRSLVGLELGELKVIGPHRMVRKENRQPYREWRCSCACGNEVWVRGASITKSTPDHRGNCGCKPARRRALTERLELMLSWREQGEKLESIALAFGVKACSVSKLCGNHGVVPLIETEHKMTPNARRAAP